MPVDDSHGRIETLLDLDEVSAALGISRRTTERLVASGELLAVKVRRLTRVRASDLANYLDRLTGMKAVRTYPSVPRGPDDFYRTR